MTVGERLAAARKAAGYTQERLAEEIGVSFQAISLWERNGSLPDTGHLAALAKALHLSLDRLLSEEEPPAWQLKPPASDADRMYTYVKARAQAAGLTQTLAALPLMREKHRGQLRASRTAETPYAVHPLTMACHALAMGLPEDDVLAAALMHDVVEDTDTRPDELPVSERVREAVRLVSYNTYLKDGEGPERKKEIMPAYYAGIAGNPLASLVKCLDRCNNLACMADGFSVKKMRSYILSTEKYVLPLLDVIKEIPEYNSAAWLLRYQMTTLLETFKRLL